MNQTCQVGETFKKKRQEMNLTLKEVENATSIRMNFLRAIEEGAMENVISPVYAQGFIKQYAIFLGLDGDSIVNENPHMFHTKENQEFSYGIGTLEVRGNPGAGVKWLPNAAWIAASVAVILAAWYLAKFLEVL